ncbi:MULTISPECIES: hypothetical protein [unclassified Paenibacillus]|uniref:hypothetical protein n=1 Tax=unclassified Paenibacillus TaxID=185978 RepID=UPI002785BF63|nr:MULTISPECIES: hypothetical protein [unclassified Paenibacillus]MDQ0900670.1 hypothetical protein [Paenibacillus sp. V4I7]MDQ0920821.1 hypothetical protein [Paenibacillus sp. V4I5]
MIEKILVVLVVYTAIFIHDGLNLKHASGKVRFVHGMLMIAALYPSLIYVLELRWPNLDELVHFFLKDPAKKIVETVKIPS